MIDLVLADPFTMLVMGATLVGGGIKTFGDIRAGQAAGAADTAAATASSELGAQEIHAANVTEYAAGRSAQDVGLRGQPGRIVTSYASGNVGGRTVRDVIGSQLALTQQRERETYGRGMDIAQQERIKGAQLFYKAGEESTAAGEARRASTIGAAGDVFSSIASAAGMGIKGSGTAPPPPSAVGDAGSVDPRWYGVSDQYDPTTGYGIG